MIEVPIGYKKTDHEKHKFNIERMLENNGGFCPCQPIMNEDTKCICKKFKESGECCCGYLVKE